MLDQMRRNANSWFVILIFAVITFVFAINFGPWAGQQASTPTDAAVVNGRVVSVPEFQSMYSLQLARLQYFRPGYTEEQAMKDGLPQMVADYLVSQTLLAELAKDKGLSISDKELVDTIKQRMAITGSELNPDVYRQWVYSNFKLTEPQFEAMLRKELLAERVTSLLKDAVSVSDAEVKDAYDSQNTKVSLDFIKVDPAFFPSPAPASAAELAKWADEHKNEIVAYYNQYITNYQSPQRVHARHILVRLKPNASHAEEQAAEKKIASALKRVRDQHEDFAAVAKEVSEDSSAQSGGDLGFFGPGDMVPAFEKAAFALKAGETSDIVKTQFGYHIIKVIEIAPAKDQTLDQVRMQIAQKLQGVLQQKNAAQDYAQALVKQLAEGKPFDKLAAPGLIKGNEKGASATAPHTGNTGLFSLAQGAIPEIGVAPQIRDAAFGSAGVINQVFQANAKFYVIHVKERVLPDAKQFEEQKKALQERLLFTRQNTYVQNYVKALKDKAHVSYNAQLLAGNAPSER